MSQHNFYTKSSAKKLRIIMGWDKPLEQFYMVVFDETGKEEDDEGVLLYSNIDDNDAFLTGVDLDYFAAILKDKFGLSVPGEMLSAIRADKVKNIVNRVENYGGYDD